jgi:hypothetical protein
LTGGFYGTGEESATAKIPALTRELGWIMMDGDCNHNLFYNIENYQQEEQQSGWFTKNKRAIQCFGKYLRVMPQITIFRSGRDILMGSQQPWLWDLGVGDLQSAHYDNAYATEVELFKGMVDHVPVLFDAGTQIMDEDVVDALRRYVENGGTYVALHQTGQDSSLIANSQPLSRLTGLVTTPHAAGSLRIVNDPPVLAAWAGREFRSDGVTLALAPAAVAGPGAPPTVIARWADGSVAMAERRIGKGRVIQLGATFWREGVKLEFLQRFLTDLGVRRTADASIPAIWARKSITKNGLQDWLVTFNNSEVPQVADVQLAEDRAPEKVWDLLTGQPVDATFADGFVTIRSVRYEPHAIHLFAVKRADLVDGISVWWGEKTRYWSRPPAMNSPGVAEAAKWVAQEDAKSTVNTINVPFNHWRFFADRADAARTNNEWYQPAFNDSSWSWIDSGPWNLIDHSLSDWHGTGLYRSTFTVPSAWTGRRVILRMYDFDLPIVYDRGDFFLNGNHVVTYQAHRGTQSYAFDVTDLLRPGNNVLAVRVQGGAQFCGVCSSIWLEPDRKFAETMSLEGVWNLVMADFRTEKPVKLPGTFTGRFLRRQVTLPPSWAGKSVFLHVETLPQWLGLVVVNGKFIGSNGYMHPYSPRLDLNITPYLTPGVNNIELWPTGTVPNMFHDEHGTQSMPIQVIWLGATDSVNLP